MSAFQRDDAVEAVIVKPIGLRPLATYQVMSVDRGILGEATGADLMTDGMSLVEAPYSAAHILILKQVPTRPEQ